MSQADGFSPARALEQAVAAYRAGQWPRAEQLCRAILHAQGNHFEALSLLGSIAAQTGHADVAADLFQHALAARPQNALAHVNYGNALRLVGRFEAALESYARAVELKPDDFEAWVNRGIVEQRLLRFEAALESYGRALQLKPDEASVHLNRGVALSALNRHEAALQSYERALQLRPDSSDAYLNRGNVQRRLKRFEAALDSYDRALKITPDDASVYLNRGVALSALRHFEEALLSFERALRLRPDYADAYNHRGVTLHESGQLESALASFERALALQPAHADACNNRGATLQELRRPEAALDSYERALRLDPDFPEAYLNRGNVLRELRQVDAALDSYQQALRLRPDYAEALSNRGQLLLELKRFEDAVDSYERAWRVNPEVDWLYGSLLHAKMHLCQWAGLDSQLGELAARIEQGKRASPPFHVLALIDSLSLQRRAAQTWVQALFPERGDLPAPGKRVRPVRIRVGYYSSDFHQHATTQLMAELFERHDRAQFELVAFSFGREAADAVTQRVAAAFDQFLDVSLKSDRAVAELSRQLEIDIAVDLKGHTSDAREGIFAYRAAPLQVGYLGYPGTTGAPYLDYLIADSTVIPEGNQRGYSEAICTLPGSYQVNDSLLEAGVTTPAREEFGLPATGFVFCCFNSAYKITPFVFDIWTRILRRTEGSVLWLLSANETTRTNLRREAAARGLDAARLVFASSVPLQPHLARHRAADLFLDTAPYNAHTTASDALRTGLPVISGIGESFAARVAASLLNAVGLPELITQTPEQYEALAVELASSPTRLSEVRQRLNTNRTKTPLFDTALFAKHLEEAYRQMYEKYQAGSRPGPIAIAR